MCSIITDLRFYTNFLSRGNVILFYFLFFPVKNKVYFSMSIKYITTAEIFNSVLLKVQPLNIGAQSGTRSC